MGRPVTLPPGAFKAEDGGNPRLQVRIPREYWEQINSLGRTWASQVLVQAMAQLNNENGKR